MAMQHLFAYSSWVDGAGIAAGSPYGCGALPDPSTCCYYGPGDVPGDIAYVWKRFAQGQIDDPANLLATPVLLFNGQKDTEVYTQVMIDTLRQLQSFVLPASLTTRFETDATHVWSLDHGACGCGDCQDGEGSLECCDVNNCNYDLSGDLLFHIYGPVLPRKEAQPGALRLVEQWSFLPPKGRWHKAALLQWGLAYVPAGCRLAQQYCRVHVNYHGCIRRDWRRRILWSASLDLNEYGEANDIIVLYPQAAGDQASGEGCWNWGFPGDDPLFDARGSVQLRTIFNIVQNLEEALARSIPVEVGGPLPSILTAERNASSPLEAILI